LCTADSSLPGKYRAENFRNPMGRKVRDEREQLLSLHISVFQVRSLMSTIHQNTYFRRMNMFTCSSQRSSKAHTSAIQRSIHITSNQPPEFDQNILSCPDIHKTISVILLNIEENLRNHTGSTANELLRLNVPAIHSRWTSILTTARY
jgi:hypothetical protein